MRLTGMACDTSYGAEEGGGRRSGVGWKWHSMTGSVVGSVPRVCHSLHNHHYQSAVGRKMWHVGIT